MADETIRAERLAVLETLVAVSNEAREKQGDAWAREQKQTREAIERLSEITNAGFETLGREVSAADTKLDGHGERIARLETRADADRRAGITAGAGTGIGVAALLAAFRSMFGVDG